MTDAKQAGRGRPRKPGKTPFNFRMSEDLRQMLVTSAEKSGLSLTEEAELRLRRDFGWEASKRDIEEIRRRILASQDANFASALRAAGLQILREIEGRPTRVIVDLETLLAEADGIARGLRSGWVDPNAPPKFPEVRTMTKEDDDQALAKIDELRRSLEAPGAHQQLWEEIAREEGRKGRKVAVGGRGTPVPRGGK
jgi:TraY domain-containing protein